MPKEQNNSRKPMLVIGGAVAVWGLLLAIGAYLELASETPSEERDPRKFFIVIASTAIFLGSWAILLAWRRHKLRSKEDE